MGLSTQLDNCRNDNFIGTVFQKTSQTWYLELTFSVQAEVQHGCHCFIPKKFNLREATTRRSQKVRPYVYYTITAYLKMYS